MRRTLVVPAAVVAFLAAASVARPVALPLYAAQGGAGVLAHGVRYVALQSGARTLVEAVRMRDGVVLRSASLPGQWGIPRIDSYQNGGVTRDGTMLVLAQLRYGAEPTSRFQVLSTTTFGLVGEIDLPGDFAFDALSPSSQYLYLIQHVSGSNPNRYVVRAYDRWRAKLLPGRIADSAQRGWVMNGMPLTRVMSADGRWAYTLYANPGGYAFVHALDTVARRAHCIGLPWRGVAARVRMRLTHGGRRLELSGPQGRGTALALDTRDWSFVARAGASPWWTLAVAGLGAALLLLAAVETRRRVSNRRRAEKSLLVPQVPGTGGV